MSESSRWFQSSGQTPTLADVDHKPFLRRHFWPPSAFGIIVISLLISVLVGFSGALIYTSSDNAHIAEVDPADQTRVAPTVPGDAEPASPSTTKPPEILNADGIAKKAAPSVWSVSSLDENGRPVEGSGFIAGSFGGQTYLLTSLAIVKAATRIPGPDIVVRNGGTEIKATLWTWQEDKDMALLLTGRTAPVVGAVSAVSPEGIQHNIFIDERRQGAPLLNEKGQILGMASLAVKPTFPGQTDFFVVPISAACERVLSCGNGTASVPSTVAPTGNNATTTTRG
jgi:S1-C subfamily serine protease